MKTKDLKIGTKLKCIKNIYYIPEDSICECDFLTLEELENSISKVCVEGDIYEKTENDDDSFLCISGSWEGEYNEGWFDMQEMIDKGVFELI